MEIALLRSSSYGTWHMCQQQYYIIYGLGYSSKPNKRAVCGTICHKVMEVLANCKKTMQDSPTKKKFVFKDEELGEFKFTYNILMSDKFVSELLDKCYSHYTTSSPHIEFNYEEDYAFSKLMVDSGLAMNHGSYDPRNQNIFKAEQPFDFTIDEPWGTYTYNGQQYTLRIKGTMDLIVKEGEDVLHFVDYNTGARKNWATGEEKTYEKLHDDFQLMLYYYAMSKLFPDYKNKLVTIIFLRDGGPFTMCYEDDTIEKCKTEIKNHLEEVLNTKNPKLTHPFRKDFKCYRLCEFYKNKWPGTNQSMCEYVENHVRLYGIENTSEKLKKPGFAIGFYSAPGSTST
jgi:hypothetical protein